MMIIDCISDLHGYFPILDGGDLLIVAGDLTARDLPKERISFLEWFSAQNYRKKIWIGGNHDNSLVGLTFRKLRADSAEYLCDSGTEFEGFKIWGTPWSLTFPGMNPHCKAFTCDNEIQMDEKYALIPDDIDILISHTPPWGILDQNHHDGYLCGSRALRDTLDRVQPRLLVCGHIHEQYGQMMYKYEGPNTWCVNCSHVDYHYKPVNKPIRIKL